MFRVRIKVETTTPEEGFQVRSPRMLWGGTCERAYLCVKQLPFLRSSAAAQLWGKDNSSLGLRTRLQKSSESCQKLTPCYVSARNKSSAFSLVPLRRCPARKDTDVLHLWLRHLSALWVPSITDFAGWPSSSSRSLSSSPSSGASAAVVAAPSKQGWRMRSSCRDEDVGGQRQMARAGGTDASQPLEFVSSKMCLCLDLPPASPSNTPGFFSSSVNCTCCPVCLFSPSPTWARSFPHQQSFHSGFAGRL